MVGRYKIKTVSELSGFSPTLLRAWELRHALLDPVRQPSGHRLYTDDDVRVLRRVGQLLQQGQSIGEIAALGRESLLAPLPQLAPESAAGVEELKRRILACAIALDEPAAREALDTLEGLLPRRRIVLEVVTALARDIGSMWVTGEASVAHEHFLSGLLAERVRSWAALDAGPVVRPQRILCACFPDELHELGLWVLTYELRTQGRSVVCLGSGLPFVELEGAIKTARAHTVCMSVTRQALYQVHRPRFAELVERNPGVRFVVGGAGVAQLEDDLVQTGASAWPAHRSLSELAEMVP